MVCTIAAVFYCYEYLLRISPSLMEPALREHFNLSASGFGLLAGAYYYAYVPMQLPVGVLMDRYGPKRLLTFACLMCVIGTFMFAGTDIFWVASLGRFLVGFGSAFAFVGVLKLATIWLPENKLGMVSGLASALGTLGAMFGDNLLHVLVHQWGWQKTINVTGISGIVLIFVLWYGIYEEKNPEKIKEATVSSFKQIMLDLGIILKNKQIWINGMYGCLVYLPATVIAELWGIPYLMNAHAMTQADASLANSLLFLGFTIGAPLMGYVSDTIKRRKPPMALGATLAACVMFIIIYMPGLNATSLNILMFFLGVFYSAQCLVFAVARELSPNEAAGTAMALTNMIVMLGAMFLQPLVGKLLDQSFAANATATTVAKMTETKHGMMKLYSAMDYQFALTVVPVGIILAAILILFLKETYAHNRD